MSTVFPFSLPHVPSSTLKTTVFFHISFVIKPNILPWAARDDKPLWKHRHTPFTASNVFACVAFGENLILISKDGTISSLTLLPLLDYEVFRFITKAVIINFLCILPSFGYDVFCIKTRLEIISLLPIPFSFCFDVFCIAGILSYFPILLSFGYDSFRVITNNVTTKVFSDSSITWLQCFPHRS